MPFYEIDGFRPVVHPSSFVHPTATLIGDVHVGPCCYVGPGAAMRGDFGRLIMGAGANLQDNCVVHGFPTSDTILEDESHIGHGAVIHGCVVRKNALIGMNAVINDGAEIGEAAIVAALAFVKANFKVPARTLVAGVPARIVRELTPQEIAWKGAATREYQDLTRRCLATFKPCEPVPEPEPGRGRLAVGQVEPLYKTKGG